MQFKIIAVVLLAALLAAGLGYGLLKLKDRKMEGAEIPATQQVTQLAPAGVAPGSLAPPSVPTPVPYSSAPPVLAPDTGAQMPPPAGMNPPLTSSLTPAINPSMNPAMLNGGMPPVPLLNMAPGVIMQASQIPENAAPVPSDVLLSMSAQDKQTYFEFLAKPTAEQKELSTKYFTALGQIELKYREITMRTIQLTQFSQSAPPQNYTPGMPPGMPPASRSQFALSLEDQQKETALMQDQIKQTIEARAALMKTLTKEQLAKIQPYIDGKVY